MDAIDAVRQQIKRSAVELEIGGFRPSGDPRGSWFGRVTWGAPNEDWPTAAGKPMLPLCQVNLTELPFRPARLDDVQFLAVFISADDLRWDRRNGQGWWRRSYASLEALGGLEAAALESTIKAFPMRPCVVEADYPCWEDVPLELPPQIDESYHELFKNASGFKFGGWPTLIQSEIFWAPWNRHPAAPEFVFQIDSTEKGNWAWGDGGVGYFGRGTAAGHENEWVLAWQCC